MRSIWSEQMDRGIIGVDVRAERSMPAAIIVDPGVRRVERDGFVNELYKLFIGWDCKILYGGENSSRGMSGSPMVVFLVVVVLRDCVLYRQ